MFLCTTYEKMVFFWWFYNLEKQWKPIQFCLYCLELSWIQWKKRYFNFISKKIEMELDLSKHMWNHMWNLKYSTQSNDVQEFHILPQNGIWIKLYKQFTLKSSKYLTNFQLGLQVFVDYYVHLCRKNHFFEFRII
jgi:hypothetical protein